jgi:hypothetical protein
MFGIWCSHIKEVKESQNNEIKAIHHDYKRLCKPCLNQWKLELNDSKQIKKKLIQSKVFYETKLIKYLFQAWHQQTKVFKEQNSLVQIKYDKKLNEKKLNYFHEWLNQTRQLKQDRLNEHLACTFYFKNLLLKSLNEWMNYTEYKSIKRYESNQALIKMQNIKKKLIYLKWKQKTMDKMNEKSKFELAAKYYSNKLIKKLISKWRIDFIQQCRSINLKNKQANWFLQMRLKTEFYFKWLVKHENEEKLKDKNRKALLFWSINVQREHFRAWFKWFQLQKLKKQRYKLALEQRNHDILKECAKKFIIYSTDSKQRRLMANKQINNFNSIYKLDLMLKYFTIWFNKCKIFKLKQNKQEPNQQKNQIHIIINESSSLEKQMIIENTLCVRSPTSRSAPRKPSFLNDSIQINNESHKKSTIDPILLMPPSAFVLNYHNKEQEEKKEEEINEQQLLNKQRKSDESKNLELIKFKKKLENYSIKSEKLK